MRPNQRVRVYEGSAEVPVRTSSTRVPEETVTSTGSHGAVVQSTSTEPELTTEMVISTSEGITIWIAPEEMNLLTVIRRKKVMHRGQGSDHRAQSTEHKSTEHRAQGTEHRSPTEHRAQGT